MGIKITKSIKTGNPNAIFYLIYSLSVNFNPNSLLHKNQNL